MKLASLRKACLRLGCVEGINERGRPAFILNGRRLVAVLFGSQMDGVYCQHKQVITNPYMGEWSSSGWHETIMSGLQALFTSYTRIQTGTHLVAVRCEVTKQHRLRFFVNRRVETGDVCDPWQYRPAREVEDRQGLLRALAARDVTEAEYGIVLDWLSEELGW